MHSLALFSMLISSTAALGINCRGSGGCFVNNSSLSDLMGQIKQIQNQGHGQRIYDTGVQIACAEGKFGQICAFYQSGAKGTADRAAELVQGLLDHGCKQCGSNPTSPGNSVRRGQLTVNIVSSPCCKGNCVCPM